MSDTCDLDGLTRAEDRLQDAVRSGNAVALAEVLHDRLLATGPDARVVGKQEDVSGYASGAFGWTRSTSSSGGSWWSARPA